MTRYGQQFGPDFTFLGVPACDLDDPASYAADVPATYIRYSARSAPAGLLEVAEHTTPG